MEGRIIPFPGGRKGRKMGGPVPPTPSGELAVDVAPAVLVPNSSVGALSVKQLQRLQTLSLPIPEHLLPTEVQGRFEPRPLVGDSAGALDPRLAETFQYSAVTPAALRTSLTAGWGVEGFSTVPDPAGPTLRRLPKEAGFEITGTVFAERHLV